MALIIGPSTLLSPDPVPLLTPDPGPLLTAPTARDWIAPVTAPDLNASVAGNWSPNGAPAPGDTLTMHQGIMDVAGFALAGDTLTVGTANQVAKQQINLTDGGALKVETASGSTDTLNIFASGANHDVSIKAQHSTITAQIGNATNNTGDLTANTFDLTDSTLDVTGGTGFLNTGVIGLHQSAMFIHDDLEGTGKIVLDAPVHGSTAEFGASVSSSQSIEVDGNVANKAASSLIVDNPESFQGVVTLQYGHVDLHLATIADSYSYANDMMTIFRKGVALDTLQLKAPSSFQGSPLNLTVSQTAYGVVVDNSNAVLPGAIALQHIS